jgi:hypothetical protein
MRCIRCHRAFLEADRAAAISGSIMGDEHTDAYFLCPVCDAYTVATWRDNFTGVESEDVSGPLPRADGDRLVELIRRCRDPWDKKCGCVAHRRYFNDTLD